MSSQIDNCPPSSPLPYTHTSSPSLLPENPPPFSHYFSAIYKKNTISSLSHSRNSMSGGVGPCSEIGLPNDEQQHKQDHDHGNSLPKTNQKSLSQKGFFSLRQLNSLALIIIFSATGMVGFQDLSFVLFSLFYIYFMSKVAFPTLSPATPVFSENNRLLSLYVFAGAVIGLFLPIAYIFQGIYEGDKEGIKAAVPHVFLLASQIFMEGLTFSDRFSLPIRVLVPVVYNAMRIFAIMEWLSNEMKKVEEEYGGSERRLYIGKALAVGNMAFWGFNLFGFLLPYYMPMAFQRYYAGQKLKL